MKSAKTLRSIVKNNLWMLKQVWKHTPMYIIGMIFEGIVWGINNSIGIIYTRNVLDALGNGTPFRDVAHIVIVYIVYMVVFYVFHFAYWYVFNPLIRERLSAALSQDLFSHALQLDLAKYDDPDFYNEYIWSMNQTHTQAIGLIEDTGKLINRLVASSTLITVLLSVDVSVALVILAIAVLQIALQQYSNKLNLEFSEKINPTERKIGYINRIFKLAEYAKEVRISHVGDIFSKKLDESIEEKKGILRGFARKRIMMGTVSSLLTAAGNGIPLIMILYKVMVSGTLGVGGFAIAVNALWTMSWLLGDMLARIMKYHEHGIFIEKIHRFLETGAELKSGKLPTPAFNNLTIRNLSFRYPGKGAEKPVLNNVNMDIRKGEKIAIVGYNGAGKTTLTKLIMHLYDPDEGEILYNGAPLSEFDVQSFRNRIAAVFQDHRIFAATIAENVVGGCYSSDKKEAVYDALCAGTFDNKLAALPKGTDTVLTKEFDAEGTMLSGGEQQKIALARAFFKDADILILDEPSAALDPEAEYALNRSITSHSNDKTIIFISHRLSTTRHADRIYMFDDGRIVESGTHEELMNLNGKYAYMFSLQAKEYEESHKMLEAVG